MLQFPMSNDNTVTSNYYLFTINNYKTNGKLDHGIQVFGIPDN